MAEAADGSAAATAAAATAADVILMDIELPGVDGIAGTRQLISKRAECRVLVLTMFDLDEYVLERCRREPAASC